MKNIISNSGLIFLQNYASKQQIKKKLKITEIMSVEYNQFANLNETKSLVHYSKIQITNEQLLNKSDKLIITFVCQNKQSELHEKIF